MQRTVTGVSFLTMVQNPHLTAHLPNLVTVKISVTLKAVYKGDVQLFDMYDVSGLTYHQLIYINGSSLVQLPSHMWHMSKS